MADPHRRETARALARARWRNSRLTGPRLSSPEEIVRWLGAVQAQELAPAKWSIAQRSAGLAETDIDRAFAEGKILRTHVLRPTWHFVPAVDIRWMLELTAPRIEAVEARRQRQLGLDARVLRKTEKCIERALSKARALTRAALAEELNRSGVETPGERLSHLLAYAELRGLICSGPPRGKHQTYALLEERAPQAITLARDEALAELALRYYRSHGPATTKDLQWWASLALVDVRRGLELAGDALAHETIDGIEYWFAADSPPRRPRERQLEAVAYLLQPYEECIVGCCRSKHIFDVSRAARAHALRGPAAIGILLIGDQVAGRWRRTNAKDGLVIEIAPNRVLRRAERQALRAATTDFGRFFGLQATIKAAAGSRFSV